MGSTLQVRVSSLSSGRIRNSGGYSDNLIPEGEQRLVRRYFWFRAWADEVHIHNEIMCMKDDLKSEKSNSFRTVIYRRSKLGKMFDIFS